MSQSNRRLMSLALQTPRLSPEALALIREGTPQPQTETPVIAPPEPTMEAIPTPSEPLPQRPTEDKAARAKAPTTRTELSPVAAGVGHASFRLPIELQQTVLRVSLERKLARQKPWTQQDIAAEAFGLWLKKNGYLP